MSKRIWTTTALALALGVLLSACGPYPAASTPIPTLAPRQVTPAAAEEQATPEAAAPTNTPEMGGEPAGAAIDLDAALEVYAEDCQGCHGANGENGAVGPTLHPNADLAAKSDDDIRAILLNGIEGSAMPAFKDRLSDAQINNLVALLRSWQE